MAPISTLEYPLFSNHNENKVYNGACATIMNREANKKTLTLGVKSFFSNPTKF